MRKTTSTAPALAPAFEHAGAIPFRFQLFLMLFFVQVEQLSTLFFW